MCARAFVIHGDDGSFEEGGGGGGGGGGVNHIELT